MAWKRQGFPLVAPSSYPGQKIFWFFGGGKTLRAFGLSPRRFRKDCEALPFAASPDSRPLAYCAIVRTVSTLTIAAHMGGAYVVQIELKLWSFRERDNVVRFPRQWSARRWNRVVDWLAAYMTDGFESPVPVPCQEAHPPPP